MKMTPAMLIIGALMVFWASLSVMILIPVFTMEEEPSEIWRRLTDKEAAGHRLYVENGGS